MSTHTQHASERRGGVALVFGALLAGLVAASLPSVAAADQARPEQVQTAPNAVAVVTVVRARDLMSWTDRRTYRDAIRQAPDAAARQRIHAEWAEKLQARATEHGVIMVIETRMMRPDLRRAAGSGEASARPLPPRAP